MADWMQASHGNNSHLILTVHGIRTFGQWQERLEALVSNEDNQIEFANYKYGYFSIIAFIIPFFRWIVVRRFRRELLEICTKESRTRIDLVGHSFGTHIIAWAIARLPNDPDLRIHTVILSGSVLKGGFPWRDLLTRRVQRVVNDCGTQDAVLLLSQFFVLFTGMAGRTGFSGLMGDRFRNRYSVFGHSGYFQDEKGFASDAYMSKHWVPLLIRDERISDFDFRKPSALDGLLIIFSDNAEPIKVCVYLAPFVVLILWISGLYFNAESQRLEALRQRDIALTNESRRFADTARQELKIDPVAAALIALEGLPDQSSGISRPFVIDAEKQLYDAVQSQRELKEIHPSANLSSLQNWKTSGVFMPIHLTRIQNLGNNRFLSAYGNDSIRIWDTANDTFRLIFSSNPGEAAYTTVSRDGRRVVAVSKVRVMRVWDTETGRLVLAAPKLLGGVAVSANSHLLAAVTEGPQGGIGQVWSLTSGQHVASLGDAIRLDARAFSADSNSIVGIDSTETIDVWDVRSGEIRARRASNGSDLRRALSAESNGFGDVRVFFSSNNNEVVVLGQYDGIKLIDVRTGRTTDALGPRFSSFAISRSGTRMLLRTGGQAASSAAEYALFDTANLKSALTKIPHHDEEEEIILVSYSVGGGAVAVLRRNGNALLIDPSGNTLTSFSSSYFKFSRDGKWLVNIQKPGKTIEVRSSQTGAVINTTPVRATLADIDDDLSRVYTVGDGNTIFVWRYALPLGALEINGLFKEGSSDPGSTRVFGMTFSPDRKTIAVAAVPNSFTNLSGPGEVSVWDLRSGKRLSTFRNFLRRPILVYSEDSHRILISDMDEPEFIWDWRRESSKLSYSSRTALTPNQRALVENRFMKVRRLLPTYRVRTDDAGGLVVQDEFGRRRPVGNWKENWGRLSATTSSDGKRLAISNGLTGSIKIMQLFDGSDALVREAKRAMPRCLTQGERNKYHMTAVPPRWCITGPGLESEKDPAKWSGLWPYTEKAYQDWLVASDKAQSEGTSVWAELRSRITNRPSTVALPDFPHVDLDPLPPIGGTRSRNIIPVSPK